LCREGLARFCIEDYSVPQTQDCRESPAFAQAHFSNYSVSKESPNFWRTCELIEANEAPKQTLASYYQGLENLGIDTKEIKKSIFDLVKQSLRALKPHIEYSYLCEYSFRDKPTNYHIIGYDIMLDSELQPWLLEINANPSLMVTYKEEETIKAPTKVSAVDMYVKSG
jgi:hypothetical protein